MAKIGRDTVARWREMAATFLSPHGKALTEITDGSTAWFVASRSGITEEAYKDREIVDAHIQTALETIFPNAVFRDKKRY